MQQGGYYIYIYICMVNETCCVDLINCSYSDSIDCRLFEYLAESNLNIPVIHHLEFPAGTHRYSLQNAAVQNLQLHLVLTPSCKNLFYCLPLFDL